MTRIMCWIGAVLFSGYASLSMASIIAMDRLYDYSVVVVEQLSPRIADVEMRNPMGSYLVLRLYTDDPIVLPSHFTVRTYRQTAFNQTEADVLLASGAIYRARILNVGFQ